MHGRPISRAVSGCGKGGAPLACFAALLLVLVSCAPAGLPARRGSDAAAGPRAPKTLSFAVNGEPSNLAIPGLGNVPTGSTGAPEVKLAVHHRLANFDDRGEVHPMLAAELPSQAKGTWVLSPDGTMQTIYSLRQNVTWHDGRPLTARDFVFALTVTQDPEVAVSSRLPGQISRVEARDDYTVVYHWKGTYPFASALTEDEAGPLPAHILEEAYRGDKERFQQLGYWTRDFIGTGPYRVDRWEPASHIVLSAYDGFYGGRAKIDTLVVRFFSDEGALAANLLAGAVDGSLPDAIDFNRALFVKEEWERAGATPVFLAKVTHWRLLEVQLRPELARPQEITDVRVRRGLLHALDRQALANALFAGYAPPSDGFVPTDDVKWDWVRDVTTVYPYDPRRAQELLAEAGWRRGADGTLANAAGERVVLPIWTRPGAISEPEMAIVADYWKAVGAASEQVVLSAGQARDNKTIATFPGFTPTGNPLAFENTLNVVYGGQCPSEETRWSGRNHGCYVNAEYDRAVDGLRTAIDPEEQRRLWREMARIYTTSLPVFPLYFNTKVTLFRDGVTGVKGDTKPRTSTTWNVQEWDVR